METDRRALEKAGKDDLFQPVLRFFQWESPTVTYGYLMNETAVRTWAAQFKQALLVQRPTGGGAVFHDDTDLSFSVLWQRGQSVLPEKPRDCYEEIHRRVQKALISSSRNFNTSLFVKTNGACADNTGGSPPKNFSVCFEEPVCNDVMADGKKIVGGALRLTKQAILYQGTIQIKAFALDAALMKQKLKESF